jgi:hypothetical protein
MSRRLDRFLLPAMLLVLAAGCASMDGGGGKAIGEIHLFGLPTALTVAGSSVPGGVGVRIYAGETGGFRGLPIRRGRLEVLMFDHSAAGLDPQTEQPLKVWSFEAADLAPFESHTMVGTGYQLELRWDQDRPKGKVFTVVARYRGSSKSVIYSAPAAIAVATH